MKVNSRHGTATCEGQKHKILDSRNPAVPKLMGPTQTFILASQCFFLAIFRLFLMNLYFFQVDL